MENLAEVQTVIVLDSQARGKKEKKPKAKSGKSSRSCTYHRGKSGCPRESQQLARLENQTKS